jgi:hypothetical protein|tara:strand:+ start:706 stop:3873 length:3168 start_codon:yes stop_codon:yes gene_type:complete
VQKVGPGVLSIAVKLNKTKGFRYFHITRLDGTTDDVSFRKCVDAAFPGFGRGDRALNGSGSSDAAARRDGDSANSFGNRNLGKKPNPAAMLTRLITDQDSVRGVLRVLRKDSEVLQTDSDTHQDTNSDEYESSHSQNTRVLNPELDKTHVAAAFVMIGKLCSSASFLGSSGIEPGHETVVALTSGKMWVELVRLAKDMAADGRLDARAAANALHAVARIANARVWRDERENLGDENRGFEDGDIRNLSHDRVGSDDRDVHGSTSSAHSSSSDHGSFTSAHTSLPAHVYGLVLALEARVTRVAPAMTPQAVANALWAFAALRWELGEEAWEAFQVAIVRCGGKGGGYGSTTLKKQAKDRGVLSSGRFLQADEHGVSSRRLTFNAQETANAVWAVAKLGWSPDEQTWRAIDEAVTREAPTNMTSSGLAMTFWAYATLGQTPGASLTRENSNLNKTLAAVEFGISRLCVQRKLSPRDVSNLLWSFVTLEICPSTETRIAMDKYCVEVLRDAHHSTTGSTTSSTNSSTTSSTNSSYSSSTNSSYVITPSDLANQAWAIGALCGISGLDGEDGYPTKEFQNQFASDDWVEAIEKMETALCECGLMSARATASAMLGIATNHSRKTRVNDSSNASAQNAWFALGENFAALLRNSSEKGTDPADLANVWYAHAAVGVSPKSENLKLLQLATASAAPLMAARHVSTVIYAYAKLGLGAESAVSNESTSSDSSSDRESDSFQKNASKNGSPCETSRDVFLAAVAAAAARVASGDETSGDTMNAQAIAQTLWAFCAIEAVCLDCSVRVLGGDASSDGSDALVRVSGVDTADASDGSVRWVFSGQTTRSHETLRTLWDAARALDLRSVLDVTACTFFHAHLMCEELLVVGANSPSNEHGIGQKNKTAVTYPLWIATRAKRAWMQNVNREVDVSTTHFLVAETLRRMNDDAFETVGDVVVECLTHDEYFSLDVYLPKHDVGFEVDGPTHYFLREANRGRAVATSQAYQPTVPTKVRNRFLRRRLKKLIIVPWFEFDEVSGSHDARVKYLRGKLDEAGVMLSGNRREY